MFRMQLLWACWVLLAPNCVVAQLVSSITNNGSILLPAITSPVVSTLAVSSGSAAVTTFTTTSRNESCPPCGIGASAGGLNQIAWFDGSISLTLDTVSAYITVYNGTNRTAATSYSTIYGDIATVNVSNVVEAQSISADLVGAVNHYNGGPVYLARGTDGAILSYASIPWPTPFIQISTVMYTYTTTYSNIYSCPSGMQYLEGAIPCECGVASYHPIGDPQPEGLTSSSVGLPTDFHYPLDSRGFDFSMIMGGGMNEFANLNISYFSSWLVEQPWATTLLPHIRQCAFKQFNLQGPPGVKIPVAALTTTGSTTIMIPASAVESSVKPAGTPTDSLPASTTGKESAQPVTSVLPSNPTTTVEPSFDEIFNNPTIPTTTPQQVDASGGGNDGHSEAQIISTTTPYMASPGGENDGHSDAPIVPTTTPYMASPGGEIPNYGSSDLVESVDTISSASARSGTPRIPVIVADETLSLPPSPTSNLVIAGTTLSVNGPAATLSDQYVSLAQNGLVVGSSTHSFAVPVEGATAIAAVDDQTISRLLSNGAIVVAGSTISRGSPAISIASIPVSLDPSALIIGSSTVPLSTSRPTDVFTAAGQAITLGSSGVVISGQTLTPGAQAITVSGTPVSLAASNLVIGTSTVPLPTQAPSLTSNVFAVGDYTFTSSGSDVVIADQTLGLGGPALTVSGTPISLGPSSIVIGTSTYPLPTPSQISSTFTFNGQTFTVNPNGIVVAGSTLTPGATAVAVSGTSISLGASGLVVGSSTYHLPTTAPNSETITFGGETFTIASNAVQVAGTVISEGQDVTISGTEISFGTAGLVVGSKTISLISSTGGLGDVIMSGFGPHDTETAISTPGSTNGSGSQVVAFTGEAKGRADVGLYMRMFVVFVGSLAWVF